MNAVLTSPSSVSALNIVIDDVAIDSTYFNSSDVAPVVKGDTLTIQNWKGTRRSSWGAPTCTSTVKQLSETVVMVTVTGWHKHTVSPVGGNYYFCFINGEWVRKMASAKVVKEAIANAK
jgi:hypothetical protein